MHDNIDVVVINQPADARVATFFITAA